MGYHRGSSVERAFSLAIERGEQKAGALYKDVYGPLMALALTKKGQFSYVFVDESAAGDLYALVATLCPVCS